MAKQKQINYRPSRHEQTTLIVCTIIIVIFFLFVLVATRGSLTYYTIPHVILAVVLISSLFFLNALPKMAVRFLILLGIIGAVAAIGLTLAYLPYYFQYLDYIERIKA